MRVHDTWAVEVDAEIGGFVRIRHRNALDSGDVERHGSTPDGDENYLFLGVYTQLLEADIARILFGTFEYFEIDGFLS